MKFLRRLSAHPSDEMITRLIFVCPDIWEIESGDFVIIGKDVTEEVIDTLPADASITKGEKAVKIPRRLLMSAKDNIPEE